MATDRRIAALMLIAVALSAASAGCAQPAKQIGQVAWQRDDRFSGADRREILKAATRAGIIDVRMVSKRWHRPSDNYHALVESGQTVTERRVTWVALVVCDRIDRNHCDRDRREHPWIRAGDWMTSVGSIRHEERLRVFDGSWYCDVDLADGVTDDVADVIITAVHRRILVNRTGKPDLIARFSDTPDLDGSWYYFALERESSGANLYKLHLVRDGAGVELTLRLIGDQVELVNHSFWIA